MSLDAEADPRPGPTAASEPHAALTTRPPDAEEARAQTADAKLVRGVRWRLVLFSGGATLLVLVLLGVAIYAAVARQFEATGVQELEARAGPLVAWVERSGRRPPLDALLGRGSATYAYVEDRFGQWAGPRLVTSDGEPITELPDLGSAEAAREHGRDLRQASVGDGTPVRILSEAATAQTGEVQVVQVVQSRADEQRTLDVLLMVLVLGGLASVAVATLLGAAYAQRALVPIRASLAGQRAALRRQREFAADASHELRTPLTIVRASVDHLRRHREEPVAQVGTALDDIDAEIDHLTTLVDDLLLLARSDSGALDLTIQSVELGDVAADAALAMAAPAEGRGVRVEVDPEPAMVAGDAVRLRQLITILVDNAVRHSPRGGTVGVRVRRDGRAATLTVEDEGPGIRPEDLPHVFDRFWRASGSPGGGTGLGLAIAATIVTRLGGRIGVANRPTGGAAFTVVFPLMPTVPGPA
jgi:signal transduction histidine kinase